jgi:hypothetical protein
MCENRVAMALPDLFKAEFSDALNVAVSAALDQSKFLNPAHFALPRGK